MNAGWRLTFAAGTALALVPCGLGILASSALDAVSGGCAPVAVASVGWDRQGSWDAVQVANAATIVAVGARMGVPRWGWVVAVATAMHESSLRNLGHLGASNDHDSFGLFQQRPSQGWGTPAQLMDPEYAAAAFYRKLLTIPGWERLPLTQAAQAVQVSGLPLAYAKWQPDAERLVDVVADRLGLDSCTVVGSGGWVLPLPAGSYRLSSLFGPRRGGFHYGLDMAAPSGTPILAVAAGTVMQSACTSPRCDVPGSLSMPGGGWTAVVDHGGGTATRYEHAIRLNVHSGQSVVAGQVIGWVGSTGNSTGPHLHFEVHRPAAPPVHSGNAVDPAAVLREMGLQP